MTHVIASRVLVFFLPLVLLWQSSSCHSTNMNSSNNSTPPDNTKPNRNADALSGTWGGQGIALDVTEDGVEFNFDCAHGHVDGSIFPDQSGNFSVAGTFVKEHGGPMRSDENPDEQRAVYKGQIDGAKMTLSVTIAGQTEAIGTFTLERGKSGRVRKCM